VIYCKAKKKTFRASLMIIPMKVLMDAVCRISYMVGDTSFARDYIASYPDNVIAVNLGSDRKKALTFDIILTSVHEGSSVIITNDGILELRVRVKDGALHGTAMVKVNAT